MSDCLNGVNVLLIILCFSFKKLIAMLLFFFAPDSLSQCTYRTVFVFFKKIFSLFFNIIIIYIFSLFFSFSV